MKCDRKTLYDDIELLKAEDYEILSRMKKHSKVYYVSDRKFSPAELKILMDAVQTAKFVTESKTQEIEVNCGIIENEVLYKKEP